MLNLLVFIFERFLGQFFWTYVSDGTEKIREDGRGLGKRFRGGFATDITPTRR